MYDLTAPAVLLEKKLSTGWDLRSGGGAHRYYVRPCSKPQKRAAIALAVRVGSVVETEEERGVAHILEHLVRLNAC